MPALDHRIRWRNLLTFRELFRFVRDSHSRLGVLFFALVYLLSALLGGGMLTLFHLGGGTTIEVLLGSGTGQGWWNYPGLLVIAPWGVLELPFLSTWVMVAVAFGVGLGMTVALVLAYRLVRPSPGMVARTKAVGVATGLTPAMVGLVTLGACCSTTAAATAGIGLVALASGTTVAMLLVNNWLLGLFQLAVVWVALLAQEILLTVYGDLFADRRESEGSSPTLDGRRLAGSAARVVLVVAGLAWSFSAFAEWPTASPTTAGPGQWFQWLAQHELLGLFAIGAALFPHGTLLRLARAKSGPARFVRGVLAFSALSLLLWLPPAATAAGLDSLTNQVLGFLGAPSTLGPILPAPGGWGAALSRWVVEYGLLGGFALVAALSPEKARALLTGVPSLASGGEGRSMERPVPRSLPTRTGSGPAPFAPPVAEPRSPPTPAVGEP